MATVKEYLREIMGSQNVICQQIGFIRKEIKELKEEMGELRELINSELMDDEEE